MLYTQSEINRYEQEITYDQYIYLRHYLQKNDTSVNYHTVSSLSFIDDIEEIDYQISVFDYHAIYIEKYTYKNGICKIQSVPITNSQCKSFLNGDFSWMKYTCVPLLWEVYRLLAQERLRVGTVTNGTVELFVYGEEKLKISLAREGKKTVESKFLLDEKKSAGAFVGGTIRVAVSDEYCDYTFGNDVINHRLLPTVGEKKICWA